MNLRMNPVPRVFAWLLPAVVLLAASGHAEVVTTLSSHAGQVGMPMQLQYQFINVDPPRDMPRSLMVDGLDIRLTGTSRRVEMVNMQTASTMIYAYTVVPNRPGNFTIPGFAVQSGGRQLRTQPVDLRVTGPGGTMPAPPGPGMQQVIPPPPAPPRAQRTPPGRGGSRTVPRTNDGEPARYFGELVMGARSAYVGEVVPVELRFYFRADCQFDSLQRPDFGGDGFTAAPLSEPEQTEQFIDDIPYNIVTFRSAVTPVKTGEIEIPPARMEGRMIAPMGGGSGFDPFFDQFFQNFPMPGFGRAENIEARTDSRALQVQALPREGRPDNFSGAIGQFTLRSSASPSKTGPGEPVTLQLKLEGRGNFDAIAAPELTSTEGWRAYAPKETFTAADAIGYGGTKTFEYNLVAREDRTATPGAQFSYFDPLKKQYFTLKTEPVAVTAAGGGAAADATAAASGDDADTTLPAVTRPDDVGAPAEQLSAHAPGFRPLVTAGWFRWLNALILALLVLLVPFLVWMRCRAKKSGQIVALEGRLRAARDAWQKAADRREFYRAAVDFLTARMALVENRPAALLDVNEVLERRVEDPVERRELQAVLVKSDEFNYGGGGGGAIDPSERERVVALLEKFAKNHA